MAAANKKYFFIINCVSNCFKSNGCVATSVDWNATQPPLLRVASGLEGEADGFVGYDNDYESAAVEGDCCVGGAVEELCAGYVVDCYGCFWSYAADGDCAVGVGVDCEAVAVDAVDSGGL